LGMGLTRSGAAEVPSAEPTQAESPLAEQAGETRLQAGELKEFEEKSGTDPFAQLSFRAPLSCPGREQLVARVQEILGPLRDTTAPPPIDIQITEGKGRKLTVVLRVTWGSGAGLRRFEGEHCPELVEATSLMVAFLLADAELPDAESPPAEPSLGKGPQPTSNEFGGSASENSAKVSTASPMLVEERKRPSWTSAVGIQGLLDSGSLGSFAPGVELEGGWLVGGSYQIDVGVLYLPPLTVKQGEAAGKFWLLSARLRLCRRLGWGATSFFLCGGLEAGALHGEALGEDPRPAFGPWLAPLLSVDAELPLGTAASRWAAFFRLEGCFPIIRDEFQVDGTTVHQAPAAVARLEMGVRLRFR
jgi:hypothetical protein